MQKQKTYRTEAAAKRAANKPYTPTIVELKDGSFDWFPAGHPIPEGSTIVSRWVINKWRIVADTSKAQEAFSVIEDWEMYKETEEAFWYKNSDGEILSVPKS